MRIAALPLAFLLALSSQAARAATLPRLTRLASPLECALAAFEGSQYFEKFWVFPCVGDVFSEALGIFLRSHLKLEVQNVLHPYVRNDGGRPVEDGVVVLFRNKIGIE